jgi:hypothetical protein
MEDSKKTAADILGIKKLNVLEQTVIRGGLAVGHHHHDVGSSHHHDSGTSHHHDAGDSHHHDAFA